MGRASHRLTSISLHAIGPLIPKIRIFQHLTIKTQCPKSWIRSKFRSYSDPASIWSNSFSFPSIGPTISNKEYSNLKKQNQNFQKQSKAFLNRILRNFNPFTKAKECFVLDSTTVIRSCVQWLRHHYFGILSNHIATTKTLYDTRHITTASARHKRITANTLLT